MTTQDATRTRKVWRVLAWVLAVCMVCLVQVADFTWTWAGVFVALILCEGLVATRLSNTPLRELVENQWWKREPIAEAVLIGLLLCSLLVVGVVLAIRAALRP